MILVFLWILCSYGSWTLCSYDPLNPWSLCSCESCAPVDLWLYASMLLRSFAPMIPWFHDPHASVNLVPLWIYDSMLLWLNGSMIISAHEPIFPMFMCILCFCGSMTPCSCDSMLLWLYASKTLCFFDSMLLWSFGWGVPMLLCISPYTYLCSVGWVMFPCFCFTARIYEGKFGVLEPSVMITLVSLPNCSVIHHNFIALKKLSSYT